MKKRINKNIFKFSLAAVILGITVVGGVFALQVQASRNATTMPDVFYSEGASVRVTEDERLAQMRFHMALENSNENYKKWFDGTKAKNGVETGIICMPYDKYQSYVSEQCKFQLENITKLDAAKTITTNGWEKGTKKIVSYAYINAADILTESGEIPYNQKMIVRGYIKDKTGVVYTEPIVASMSDVAYQSQDASVKALNTEQKAIVKETYMKQHSVHMIPLTGKESASSYTYGTPFSSISKDVFYTDEKRTQIFSGSYVTEDVVLYSATQAECNLGLDQLNGIVYNNATKGVDVVGNTQISVVDDWFSAQVQGIEGVHDFELSVTFGGMEQYASNGGSGYIGIGLKNTEGKKMYFDLIENNQNTYKARTQGAYNKENGWTKQKVTEDVTITLRRVGKQYTMSYGEETWGIDSSELEKVFTTTSVIDLRFYACMTKGITIKDWKFTSLDMGSTTVSKGLAFYALGGTNSMDEGAYTVGNSNGDWNAGLTNAKAQKDFVVSWNMKSAQKANSANGSVAIHLTNPDTGKSVGFALQQAYDNAGRAYIYSDSLNYIKGKLHSYKASAFSAGQWNIKLVRKADAYYLTLNGEKLWVGKATCMMNEVMIGDILGETVDIGFETKDWNVQGVTWSISTNEADINAAIPNVTIDDGLAFYPMGKVQPMEPEAYVVENNQISISDDWFTAQVLEANRVTDFEISVTFSGMTNYRANGDSGRIGISFKNDDDDNLLFDLYEMNEEQYYARLQKAFSKEKGKTNQVVADEITIKLRRVGQKYTMTYGTETWSFYASEISNTSGTMKEQFAISEIHDLRFYAANTKGITVKSWSFTNLDDAPKAIDEGLSFYSAMSDSLDANAYKIVDDQIQVSSAQVADWFTAKVVDAQGANDFEATVTLGGMTSGGQAGQVGIILLNEKNQYQRFALQEKGEVYHAQLAQSKSTGFAYDNGATNQKVNDDITITLKRQGGIYTFSYGSETWTIDASALKNSKGVAMKSHFATTALKGLYFYGFTTGGMLVKSWEFTNLDAPDKDIAEGLNFYAAGGTNSMDPGAYTITKANRIRIEKSTASDWFTAQVPAAEGATDFEISATFRGIPANGARLGFAFVNSNGAKQNFWLNKVNDKSYTVHLQGTNGGYTYQGPNGLESTEAIDEITLTLKRIGNKYTFSYGTEVWTFNADDLLDGVNSFESKFATTEITDLRILAYTTQGITIKSWNYSYPEQKIDEGLKFYAQGTTNPMDPGGYDISEQNQIQVVDDWFTAQVAEAVGVKNFELSVTYKGVPKAQAHLGMSFVNSAGKKQDIRIRNANDKEYWVELKNCYNFVSTDRLTSAETIDEITIKLKRIGNQYTFTYGTKVWTFNASDKLNGTDTLESMFATTKIKDLRFYAYVTGGITITSWEYKCFDIPETGIDTGLAIYAAGSTNPIDSGKYKVTEENTIEVTDDWFTAQIPVAEGVKDFAVSMTVKGAKDAKNGARLGMSFLNSSGKKQDFRIEKVNNKKFNVCLASANGAYAFTKSDGLTSAEDIDEIKITLKRVGTQYTFTYGTEVWTFDANDKIDGTNTLESKFATTAVKDLRFLVNITGKITITSWNFTNLDSQ